MKGYYDNYLLHFVLLKKHEKIKGVVLLDAFGNQRVCLDPENFIEFLLFSIFFPYNNELCELVLNHKLRTSLLLCIALLAIFLVILFGGTTTSLLLRIRNMILIEYVKEHYY